MGGRAAALAGNPTGGTPSGGSSSVPLAGRATGGTGGHGNAVGGSSSGGLPASTAGGQAGVSGRGQGSAGAGGSHAGSASTDCGRKPGAVRGRTSQRLQAAGLDRTFLYYAPPNLDPATPAPVVVVAHGWLMSGQQMIDLTGFEEIADREGFVVFFPDGEPASPGPWNVGDGACPSNLGVLPLAVGDDQAFIDAMLNFAEADRCLDREHVFVTGFSMGGYFSNETGCLRSDVAAVAPHSGGSHELESCPGARKPVLVLHGTMDGLIPVTCGEQARERWARRNGCSAEVDTTPVLGGRCEYSKNCPDGAQVALCLFEGMDHVWASGMYESSSELVWSFFRDYAW